MSYLLSDVLAKSVKQSNEPAKGGRTLVPEEDIKTSIVSSLNYKLDGSPPEAASAMRIFATGKQITWLVATPKRLYCVLDDIRKPAPHLNWSIGRDALLDDDRALKFEIKSRSKTERSGLVDISPKHKNWYFTKSLFTSQSIEQAIRTLILANM